MVAALEKAEEERYDLDRLQRRKEEAERDRSKLSGSSGLLVRSRKWRREPSGSRRMLRREGFEISASVERRVSTFVHTGQRGPMNKVKYAPKRYSKVHQNEVVSH